MVPLATLSAARASVTLWKGLGQCSAGRGCLKVTGCKGPLDIHSFNPSSTGKDNHHHPKVCFATTCKQHTCKVRHAAMLNNSCLRTGSPMTVDGKTTWSEMRISSFIPIETFFSHLKSSPQDRLKPKQHPFWTRTRSAPTSYEWSGKKT